MHLSFTAAENAFRDEVRTFLDEKFPRSDRRRRAIFRHASRDEFVATQRILNERGWAVPNWPTQWGGQDWSWIQKHIFAEELQAAFVPGPLAFNVVMVGPIIAAFGTEAQKHRFLRPTANLDIWWCQGFSEPEAGSDLANLKIRAERQGESFVVNGQKAWTTLAVYADWMFLLARTDVAAKRHQGISFLLVDLKSPGISVRPTKLIDGRHEVCEVFFSDVRVPVENLVGQENRGLDCARFLLANERAGIARVAASQGRLAVARDLLRETPRGDGTLWDDLLWRTRVARLEVELKALEITQMRIIAAAGGGENPEADPRSSLLKIKGSELQQATTELLKDIAGMAGLRGDAPRGIAMESWEPETQSLYFNTRKVSIYGGTNEIQRNIVAKTILDL